MSALGWIDRARQLVPQEDRKVLLSPPRLVARFARFAIARALGHAGHAHADDLDARDPELVGLMLAFYVPVRGPVLLVGNHNGAFLPSDAFFTGLAIHERDGPERRMYALAHDVLFEDPLLRSYAQRLGMLRAGHDGAHRALAAGDCVLVYPGSDLDAFRPFRERAKIVLGGRKGFLKLALRERAPIVPVVSVGTHEQLLVLTRGDRIARLTHAHAWARTEVVPIVLSLPWGITSGFLPYLPLPAQTTVAFGEPITWPDLGPRDAEEPAVLARCYTEVETRMQAMLDRLSRGRRFLLGKRAGFEVRP